MTITRLLIGCLVVVSVRGFSPVQPWLVNRPSSGLSRLHYLSDLRLPQWSPAQSPRVNSSLSSSNNDNSKSKKKQAPVTTPRRSSRSSSINRRVLTLTAAVALSTAANLWLPSVAQAVDLPSIMGGSTAATPTWLSGLSDTGFYQAFSLVFLSEIGDKTFFIAGLLSMKTSRIISFLGSMAALAAMTIVSVVIGQVFHAVPEGFANGIPLDDVAAVVAFLFFGIKTLVEAFQMQEGESVMDEEFADAQEAVEGSETVKQVTPWGQLASIFALVFAAEFGDRSFLSTIALSAAQNPVAVAGGAIAAHGVATGIAVSGGAYLAKYVSERVIGIIGGTLFIVFAITTALGIF